MVGKLLFSLALAGAALVWAPDQRCCKPAAVSGDWVYDIAVGGVDLPTSYVNTDYTIPTCTEIDVGVTPTGDCKTITVDTGQNLQTALTDARRGDRIALGCDGTGSGGVTLQAPNGGFIIPDKTGTGFLYITPNDDCIGSLPAAGNRVIPDDLTGTPCDESDALYCVSGSTPATPNFDVSMFPTVLAEALSPFPAFKITNGMDSIVMMGFTVRPATDTWSSALITTSTNDAVDAGVADIIIDRMYLPGDPPGGATKGGGRAVAFTGCDRCAVSNSYINNWYDNDSDTQGILICEFSNVVGIYNNYVSATGENIFSDMCGSRTANDHVTDLDVRWNLVQKELDWVAEIGSGLNNYKNLYETKASCRVLIEGNIFRNSYASNGGTQAGQETSFNIKEGDEDVDKYTCHHTIRKNLWQYGIGNAVKLCLAHCNSENSTPGHDLVMYNNVMHVDGAAYGRSEGQDGHCVYHFVPHGDNMIYANNTCLNKGGPQFGTILSFFGSTYTCDIRNNIGNDGGNPVTTAELNEACGSGLWTMTGNVIVAGTEGNYPATQAGFPAAWSNVGFTSYNSGNYGGDFSLPGASDYDNACTDTYNVHSGGASQPCGANTVRVASAVSCVLTGQCATWTPAPAPAPLYAGTFRPIHVASHVPAFFERRPR